MTHKKIVEARDMYEKGEMTFKELDAIFFKYCTSEELNAFMKAPVYDRPSFIKGYSQARRDELWNKLLNKE